MAMGWPSDGHTRANCNGMALRLQELGNGMARGRGVAHLKHLMIFTWVETSAESAGIGPNELDSGGKACHQHHVMR